ncbi:hypothetical protein PDN14_26985 [Bacillus cereus group sp. Bc222]|uniref:hypothetical protein n=1 Tax=Bacillus cereus group TaxID=86661 RepID=UPI001F5607DD|nr:MULTISPECIES: hypothetical protein [Bacillus cereus group]MDA2242020.1 hypothetical protein [Bacillus cereus group sp. Bc222]MEB9505247.1 hypothetical protein [Bacillus anthracis]
MGIGQKLANQVIDITGSLVKRGLNDAYTIGKELTKHTFKTTFKVAKYTTKFSFQAVKYFSAKAKQYHAEKQLTKQKSMNIEPRAKYNAKFNQFAQQPQQQVQKQNNVVYAEHFQQQTGQKLFQERHLHDYELKNVQKFHQDMLDGGFVDGEKAKNVKKVVSLLQEERKMLVKNKVYKTSEYVAGYDYLNNTDKGKKAGIKHAVKHGDVKEFQNEYKEKYEIVRADISAYYQKLEKTKDPQEKAFWAGRLENYASSHKYTLRENGLGKSVEDLQTNKPTMTKTEKLEAKLQKLESLKKGMKLHDKVEKKVATMENSRLKFAMKNRNSPSFEDMFLKTDKERQDFRESQKRLAAERKAHAEREIYF